MSDYLHIIESERLHHPINSMRTVLHRRVMSRDGWIGLLLGLTMLVAACGDADESSQPQVHSYLEGRLTVNAAIDSIPDYRDFEVLVMSEEEGGADTLGFTTTDSTGVFHLDITAPERGIYPLVISRRETVLKVDELAVADGDSAELRAEFPVGQRPLRIRSRENAAWMAYRNTKAQHQRALVQTLKEGTYDEAAVAQSIGRTSSILWGLRATYPNTMAAEIGAAESIAMLGGWNDSLVVERAEQLDSSEAGYVEVVRAARRAQARIAGQDSALALVRRLKRRADASDRRAAIQSEIVMTHMDSLQREDALTAARELQADYPESDWADWADRAIYEIEHLMPGMEAPSFTATAYDGTAVRLSDLMGDVVLLEFYRPEDQTFQQELPARNALYDAFQDDPFTILSVSVQPDSVINEAFFDGRDVPGLHVIAPGGLDDSLALAYNINVMPTRYLIDREGKIAEKYVGSSMSFIQRDVATLLEQEQQDDDPS